MTDGDSAAGRRPRHGVMYGAAAFTWWGFAPFYFKAVAAVPAREILAHRIIWSFVFLMALLAAQGRLATLRPLLRDRRTMLTLVCTTALIAVNWLIFIWAVANDRLLEASLGYFINPLVMVLLGFVFLRERLSRLQTVAVALAAAGVVWLALGRVGLPHLSLALAFTFGLYGLLRKVTPVDGTRGLAIETLLLTPAAVVWLAVRQAGGEMAFLHAGTGVTVLLLSAGVITALPLIWFAEAARRLRYATLGFLQYLSPSLQFLLAVAAFGESFTRQHALGFGCIWAALAVYSYDTFKRLQEAPQSVPRGGP